MRINRVNLLELLDYDTSSTANQIRKLITEVTGKKVKAVTYDNLVETLFILLNESDNQDH